MVQAVPWFIECMSPSLRACSCAAASATPADADQGGWDGCGESWENIEPAPWPGMGAHFTLFCSLTGALHCAANASCFCCQRPFKENKLEPGN